jgi:hypothetical protein
MQRVVFSCKTVACVVLVDSGVKWVRGDKLSLPLTLTSDCKASNRSLYCTADDGLLNDSDISAGSGFFVKYDSRTRNPKFVVQRSVDVTDVSRFCIM